MKFSAIFAEAWISMGANKLRSFLTMLGIIIGVASVVLMLSIGQGVQNKINESIASMGSHLFIILSGASSSSGVRVATGSAPTLTIQDAKEIAQLSGVTAVGPTMPGSAQVVYNSSNWNTSIMGITTDYLRVREWGLTTGQNITDQDLREEARYAILGQTVVTNLFGSSSPMGQTIRIKNIPFEIIGVLDSKGQSLDGRDQDDVIFVPLTTAQRKLFGSQFPDSVRFIMVKADSDDVMDRLERSMTRLLQVRHHILREGDEDFTIRNLAAVAESAQTAGQAMSLLLAAISSISLVVGGIGIMNIMLVSVTERTREIGIRKAIGAYERDILLQFLLESILISATGGLIGLGLGVGGAYLVTHFSPITTSVSLSSIIISLSVAVGVGVFFGFYPARKAARLKPIDALRYQ